MSRLRYDGRVAIVTGGGRGLGRSYAKLLASRGASVVVNDNGAGLDGSGCSEEPAKAVVEEILAAGGVALADTHSVASAEGGEALVAHALDSFGRVDIVINNAGILRDKAFHNMTHEMWDAVHGPHLRGAFNVTKPAYVKMRAQGHGRIVVTSSNSGLLGNFGQSNYGAAKMGLVGLMNVLKIEGAKYDIKVNAITGGLRRDGLGGSRAVYPQDRARGHRRPSTPMLYLTGSTTDMSKHLDGGRVGFLKTPNIGNVIGPDWLWAAGTGCFGGTYVGDEAWFRWLGRFTAAERRRCLFATAPDVPYDAAATLARSLPWLPAIRSLGFPAAFVSQDGAGDLPWEAFDVLFIGGGTRWKLRESPTLIAEAKRRGKRVHVGRVNSKRRYLALARLGADSADGTFTAFGPKVNAPKVLDGCEWHAANRPLWEDGDV